MELLLDMVVTVVVDIVDLQTTVMVVAAVVPVVMEVNNLTEANPLVSGGPGRAFTIGGNPYTFAGGGGGGRWNSHPNVQNGGHWWFRWWWCRWHEWSW